MKGQDVMAHKRWRWYNKCALIWASLILLNGRGPIPSRPSTAWPAIYTHKPGLSCEVLSPPPRPEAVKGKKHDRVLVRTVGGGGGGGGGDSTSTGRLVVLYVSIEMASLLLFLGALIRGCGNGVGSGEDDEFEMDGDGETRPASRRSCGSLENREHYLCSDALIGDLYSIIWL
ncbi:hypothetical protein H6P81_002258 [Aristolochia fimbriata]|uniref:Uncharacterized protein n=1 Tax=Aristolochia fimbriata TaxID=158543 RepID=A0AAV7FC45_ARIFI|nr:hypothetical protein H6P81_002258 [Aristolochia fimbriata]